MSIPKNFAEVGLRGFEARPLDRTPSHLDQR